MVKKMSDKENSKLEIKESKIKASDRPVFDLTLQEFCANLSKTDKRVELIAAFFYDETKNGRVKDTESGFKSRYLTFAKKPV